MKTNKFKITLKNKDSLQVIEKTVNVLSFAEAASRAYLTKNLHGYNFEITSVKKLEN